MSPQTEPEVTEPETPEPEVTEPDVTWHGIDIADYDGNCLMSLSRMEKFIRIATLHSARCGKQLVLIRRDVNCGSKVHHLWKCPCCSHELSMNNCDMVRSSEVAEGAAFSRLQPDFNLRIVKGTQLT